MKVLVLDNYDSFTYNLVHIIREMKVDHEVHRNDRISVQDVARFDCIILSPGPGIPSESGIMPEIISSYFGKKPMLGICLGHQAIAEHMGAKLENMEKVFHGRSSVMTQKKESTLFEGLPAEFQAGRYHSWKVSKANLPAQIDILVEDEVGDIMAFEIKNQSAYGVQFHPESIMTEGGDRIIQNFIQNLS